MKLQEYNTSQQHMIDCAVSVGFKYVPQEELERDYGDVLLEGILREKLLELNKGLYEDADSFADEAILTLRRIINSADQNRLISPNKEFFEWINGDYSLKQGKDHKDIPVNFIDFKNPLNNSLIVSKEVQYPRSRYEGGSSFDFVAYINGIPFVVGEAKTPFNEDITVLDGADDIYNVYQKRHPKFFVPNLLCISSDGHQFLYAGIGTDPFHWGPWKPDGIIEDGTSESVDESCRSLLRPEVLLDISKFFVMYRMNENQKLTKIVCRYQQYEGANGIVKRALTKDDNRGLIHHFQGSGKSFLMLFAAQKLRMQESLNNPTVIIVIDRLNLDDQINADFLLADVPNVMSIDSIDQLQKLLSQDSHYIFITMIHKFRNMPPNISLRDNIYIFADEAHRTQYGGLSESMRYALPNATIFGLTGTPICKTDRNTYATFASTKDKGGYLSRYDFKQSILDHETLPLTFIPWKISIEMDKDIQTEAFNELTEDLSDSQRDALANRASRAGSLLMQDGPATEICTHVKEHFLEHVKPNGFKAMLVAQDRFCCVAYKKKFDEILKDTDVETAVVIASSGGKTDSLASWVATRDQEREILDRFNDPKDPLGILIVTSKLITGFNSRILQTQYLAKYLKEHTLLQCITRVNRPYTPDKSYGTIVDFLGVFGDVKKALSYGDMDLEGLLSSIEELKESFPSQYDLCMSFLRRFPMKEDLSILDEIKVHFDSNIHIRNTFFNEMNHLQKLYKIIAPDQFLAPYREGYLWMLKVYKYCASRSNTNALWKEYGSKTLEIIGESIIDVTVDETFESLILDANLIVKAFENNPKQTVDTISRGLRRRISGHCEDPIYIKLAQRLEILKAKMDVKQIDSIQILKELLDITNDYLEAKNMEERDIHEYAVRALSLHLENIMTDNTPEDVEKAIHEIDDYIMDYKYDFETSKQGRREVSMQLIRILSKYNVYTPENLEKTLKYMQMCYAFKNNKSS